MTQEWSGALLVDAAVKGVVRLHAPGGVERFVKDLKEKTPVEGDVALAVLKQRRGQRALIRIDFERAGRPSTLYAKLFRRSQEASEERRDFLQRISVAAASVGVQIPSPVARLERFRALVFESAVGIPLLPCCSPGETLGSTKEIARFDRPAIFRLLGRSLAELHTNLPSTGPPRLGDFEREQIARASERLIKHREDLASRFHESLRDWDRQEPDAHPGHSESVTLHGDFYPAQVLVNPDPGSDEPQLAILDWDAILCSGEGERDIGNLEAHLVLEGIRGHLASGEDHILSRQFEEGYSSLRPIDPGRLRFYRGGSLLRLTALYADPNFGPHPPNPPYLADALLAAAEARVTSK